MFIPCAYALLGSLILLTVHLYTDEMNITQQVYVMTSKYTGVPWNPQNISIDNLDYGMQSIIWNAYSPLDCITIYLIQ